MATFYHPFTPFPAKATNIFHMLQGFINGFIHKGPDSFQTIFNTTTRTQSKSLILLCPNPALALYSPISPLILFDSHLFTATSTFLEFVEHTRQIPASTLLYLLFFLLNMLLLKM